MQEKKEREFIFVKRELKRKSTHFKCMAWWNCKKYGFKYKFSAEIKKKINEQFCCES